MTPAAFFQVCLVTTYRDERSEESLAFFETEEEARDYAEASLRTESDRFSVYRCVFGAERLRCEIATYTLPAPSRTQEKRP